MELGENEGTLTFIAKFPGVVLGAFDISNLSPQVTNLRFEEQDGDSHWVRFTIRDIHDEATAIEALEPLLNRILDRLSYFLDVPVDHPVFYGSTLPIPMHQRTGKGTHRTVVQATFQWNVHAAPQRLPPSELTQLKQQLQAPTSSNDLLKLGYRLAVRQSDSIACFMLLYNVLLQAAGDKQEAVDRLILKTDSNVGTARSPHTGKQETIFTRFRNEIGHVRGADLSKTESGVRACLGDLRAIVRELISQIREM